MLEGQRRRELRQFSADAAVAWYGAMFARAKKLPDLERFLRRLNGAEQPVRQQTMEEQLAIIKKWNKLLGGDDFTTDLDEEKE